MGSALIVKHIYTARLSCSSRTAASQRLGKALRLRFALIHSSRALTNSTNPLAKTLAQVSVELSTTYAAAGFKPPGSIDATGLPKIDNLNLTSCAWPQSGRSRSPTIERDDDSDGREARLFFYAICGECRQSFLTSHCAWPKCRSLGPVVRNTPMNNCHRSLPTYKLNNPATSLANDCH
jgi:hypothetical protein